MAGRLRRGRRREVTVINPADPAAIPLSVNPLEPRARLPGAGAHRHGAGPVPGRVRRRRAVPADHVRRRCSGSTRSCGWDPGDRRGRPGAARRPRSRPWPSCRGGAARDRRRRVRRGAPGRRARLRRRAAAVACGSARPGRFFEGGHPADIAALLRRNVVLAIEDVANDEDKAFLMGTLIIRLVEHLRLRARSRAAGGACGT